jgi:divalent metal cation (Fe/Co/Zn/Cd) transporter
LYFPRLQEYGHTHGKVDPSILSTDRGIWAVKWSFVGLFATTLIQAVVVYYSHSVALLADTIHNLVADGYHARVDGLTSLAVLFSAVGVWLGYPIADPVIGLLITLLILRIVWESAREVFTRLLDGVDPEAPDKIRE